MPGVPVRSGGKVWHGLRENRSRGCRLAHCGAARLQAKSRALRKRTAPVDTILILGAVAVAYLLAGFVKGVIGLGLPTVAIGLLGLLMSPAQAAAILVVPSLVTNIWQCVVGGDLLALVRRMWPMLVGICIGTLIGATLPVSYTH